MKWSALRSEKDPEVMVQEMETSAWHVWAPQPKHLTSCFIIVFSSFSSELVATLAIEGIVPEFEWYASG